MAGVRLAMVEDMHQFHELVDIVLGGSEHEVVYRAFNWQDAQGLIGRLAANCLQIDAILLDDNFPGRQQMTSREGCDEAIAFLDELDRRFTTDNFSRPLIIGFGLDPIPDLRLALDFTKSSNFSELPNALDGLMDKNSA